VLMWEFLKVKLAGPVYEMYPLSIGALFLFPE